MTSVDVSLAPDLDRIDDAVDIVLDSRVVIRLIGAWPSDRAAVEAQFGPGNGARPGIADITVRFVDDAVGTGPLRFLGPGAAGFTDDGFIVLLGRFRRPVRVRLPVADLGGPCEIICEHSVGRVPHLVAIVNLAVLANGGLSLHASGFETNGTATVATGWSKGGKTEALLAHCRAGARYVGDEWLHLGRDHRVSGIDEPLRVWDWHLDAIPEAREQLGGRDRSRLRTLRMVERAATGRSERVATFVKRQRFVDLPHDTIAPAGRVAEPLPLGRVFLMTSADQKTTWTRSISGHEVAERMAGSLAYERTPLAEVVHAFRYAFPAATTAAFDDAAGIERERLHTFLDDAEATEVVHPYPPDLDDLVQAMDLHIGDDR